MADYFLLRVVLIGSVIALSLLIITLYNEFYKVMRKIRRHQIAHV